MRREWILSVLVVVAMTASGCVVSNKKYQDALAEADSAKMELEKTRQQKNAMEQQVKTLKELNVKFGSEAQAARDELQRIEHGRDKERGAVESRTKELEDKVKALVLVEPAGVGVGEVEVAQHEAHRAVGLRCVARVDDAVAILVEPQDSTTHLVPGKENPLPVPVRRQAAS